MCSALACRDKESTFWAVGAPTIQSISRGVKSCFLGGRLQGLGEDFQPSGPPASVHLAIFAVRGSLAPCLEAQTLAVALGLGGDSDGR